MGGRRKDVDVAKWRLDKTDIEDIPETCLRGRNTACCQNKLGCKAVIGLGGILKVSIFIMAFNISFNFKYLVSRFIVEYSKQGNYVAMLP